MSRDSCFHFCEETAIGTFRSKNKKPGVGGVIPKVVNQSDKSKVKNTVSVNQKG